MKLIQFIDSLVPQVIEMKKVFTLCLHIFCKLPPRDLRLVSTIVFCRKSEFRE